MEDDNREVKAVPQSMSCSVCQHEIPLSEAVVPEAVDYVVHFCSLDCYAAWRSRSGLTLR